MVGAGWDFSAVNRVSIFSHFALENLCLRLLLVARYPYMWSTYVRSLHVFTVYYTASPRHAHTTTDCGLPAVSNNPTRF